MQFIADGMEESTETKREDNWVWAITPWEGQGVGALWKQHPKPLPG